MLGPRDREADHARFRAAVHAPETALPEDADRSNERWIRFPDYPFYAGDAECVTEESANDFGGVPAPLVIGHDAIPHLHGALGRRTFESARTDQNLTFEATKHHEMKPPTRLLGAGGKAVLREAQGIIVEVLVGPARRNSRPEGDLQSVPPVEAGLYGLGGSRNEVQAFGTDQDCTRQEEWPAILPASP